MKEQQKLYRDLVLEFANASDVGDAAYALIDNMKDIFDLSVNFIDNLKSNITNLMNSTQTFMSLQEGKKWPAKENMRIRPAEGGDPLGFQMAWLGVDEAIKDHHIRTVSYRDVFLENHQNVGGILDGILQGKDIRNFDFLGTFSKRYEDAVSTFFMPRLEFTENGSLRKSTSFSLKEKSFKNKNAIPGLLLGSLAYCMVEFLINIDQRRLRRCPYCNGFYYAEHIRRKRCYSDDCRRQYGRVKKQRQRADDPVKYS